MTLWIGNGAVLESSSQWQLNEFWKLNYSGRELFIFEILLTAIDNMIIFRYVQKYYFCINPYLSTN